VPLLRSVRVNGVKPELATLEWVAWYNHERLMQPLGYIPPAEAEANYYQQLTGQAAMAA